MNDTTTPTRGSRLANLYDRGQITRCTNLFDFALVPVGLVITWWLIPALQR